MTIVPDELTNALLVRASREDFEVLTEAVTQLDIRPLQVLIEVLIVRPVTIARFPWAPVSFSRSSHLATARSPAQAGRSVRVTSSSD